MNMYDGMNATETARLLDSSDLRASDFIKDGIVVVDAQRRVVFVDDASYRMLGLPAAKPEDDLEKVRARIQFAGAVPFDEVLNATARDGSWRGEAAGLTADDHAILLDITAQRLTDSRGTDLGTILILRNVLRDGLMEERVLEAQQLEFIEKLSRGIAHEFKNLLTIIMAYGSLLEAQLEDGEMLEEIQKVMETSQRANELVRRIVSVTRRPEPEIANTDLEDVMYELRGLLSKALPSQIHFSVAEPRKMPVVHADSQALIRCIVHLALNACDAMPEGGSLDIEFDTTSVTSDDAENHPAKRPGTYVVVSVSDTGFGILPEVRTRLFEPFFTTKEKGLGLGMCSVRHHIMAMNGWMDVYSEPGNGTCVKLYLPTVGEVEEPRLPFHPGGGQGAKQILIVDDDDVSIRIAQRMLERGGFRVLTATSGAEAVKLVQAGGAGIDAVLLDVVMPEMNGEEVYRELHALRPSLPVLVTSGFPKATVDHLIPLNDLPCISKPFTQVALINAIEDVLSRGE